VIREEYNPVSIERDIRDTVNEIVKGVDIAAEAYGSFKRLEREFDLAFAQAYMAYTGPAHAKKYAAEIATNELRVEVDAADVAHRYADRRNKALETQLDALRSIGVSVRQAYDVAGRGGTSW